MDGSDGRDSQSAPGQMTPFDAIRREDENGNEFWSARELGKLLGYTEYGKFRGAIARAEQACESSGHAVSDHFAHMSDMIATGKGARRQVENVRLSRYACYLLVQNADPEKPIVALGQTYFAIQTRRQELSDFERMTEAQRRLRLREQMASRNNELAATAKGAGVITSQDFAIFQDHGYMGLYDGERARDIHARKGLKRGQRILDHMGATELAANWFRATQAEEKIRREGVQGREAANQTHYAVGQKVRQTIADLGGTMPEDLPTPEQSIQQVERAERARIEREVQRQRQPALFGEGESGGEE